MLYKPSSEIVHSRPCCCCVTSRTKVMGLWLSSLSLFPLPFPIPLSVINRISVSAAVFGRLSKSSSYFSILFHPPHTHRTPIQSGITSSPLSTHTERETSDSQEIESAPAPAASQLFLHFHIEAAARLRPRGREAAAASIMIANGYYCWCASVAVGTECAASRESPHVPPTEGGSEKAAPRKAFTYSKKNAYFTRCRRCFCCRRRRCSRAFV